MRINYFDMGQKAIEAAAADIINLGLADDKRGILVEILKSLFFEGRREGREDYRD